MLRSYMLMRWKKEVSCCFNFFYIYIYIYFLFKTSFKLQIKNVYLHRYHLARIESIQVTITGVKSFNMLMSWIYKITWMARGGLMSAICVKRILYFLFIYLFLSKTTFWWNMFKQIFVFLCDSMWSV